MSNLYPYDTKRKKINAGFRVGLIGVAIMLAANLVSLLIFQGKFPGDWLVWGIQLLVYFLASQSAAQRHYDSQERSLEALRGVRAAGVGAAIIISLAMWLFILVRDLVMDALGMLIIVEPLSTFCRVVIDVLLAIGLGSWGGRIVEKKYKGFEGYDSDNF